MREPRRPVRQRARPRAAASYSVEVVNVPHPEGRARIVAALRALLDKRVP